MPDPRLHPHSPPESEDPLASKRREYRIGRGFSFLVTVAGLVLLLTGDSYLGPIAALSGGFFVVLYGYLLRRLESRGGGG
jgi:4-hydroxybenzoate polyprenyltransferase